MADDPTNGVKAGIAAVSGATSSVDGVPPSVLNTARNIALQTGGNPAGVSEFMRQQGYPQHAGEWCGDFAAAVVRASGGTPPPNSAAAGAWASFGSPRQGGPQPGDVAVMRGADNKTGYPYTHVTFVDSVNPDGTFVGLGGNQGGGQLKRSIYNASGFDFRDPAGASAPFTMPANAPMGMQNNNPLNIKYVPGAPYAGLVGPSKNTDQGDPQMVFSSPEAGWSAAYQLLNRKYGNGMTTPAAIIAGQGGWTPGNMQAAANVAKSAGIGVNDDIGFNDPGKAAKFMRALVTQEQGGAGSAYSDSMIANAIAGKALPSSGTSTAPATPGTTLTSLPAASSSGALPGFGTKDASDQFLAGLKKAGITPNQGDQGNQQPDIRPSPIMSGPGLRNASSPQSIGMQASQLEPQLTGYQPQAYGSSLNSQPLAWSTAPIGAPPWLQNAGPQTPQGAPGLGTSLNSLQMACGLSPQQLQMMMNPMMLDQGGG